MRIPAECRVFLSALSRLLEAGERQEWLAEWQGEVWHWWASSPQDADARIELWKHCAGAWFDARYLSRGSSVVPRPGFALAVIAALLVLIVAASGGLHNTRRLLRGLHRGGSDCDRFAAWKTDRAGRRADGEDSGVARARRGARSDRRLLVVAG